MCLNINQCPRLRAYGCDNVVSIACRVVAYWQLKITSVMHSLLFFFSLSVIPSRRDMCRMSWKCWNHALTISVHPRHSLICWLLKWEKLSLCSLHELRFKRRMQYILCCKWQIYWDEIGKLSSLLVNQSPLKFLLNALNSPPMVMSIDLEGVNCMYAQRWSKSWHVHPFVTFYRQRTLVHGGLYSTLSWWACALDGVI